MRSPARPAKESSAASSNDSSLPDGTPKKPLPAGLQKRLRLFACAYGLNQGPDGTQGVPEDYFAEAEAEKEVPRRERRAG